MNISLREDEVMADFILDYSEQCLTGAEELSFSELMRTDSRVQCAVKANEAIPGLLQKLPQKGVSDLFDRRMAAAFAMELEKENTEQNLNLRNGLSLPATHF